MGTGSVFSSLILQKEHNIVRLEGLMANILFVLPESRPTGSTPHRPDSSSISGVLTTAVLPLCFFAFSDAKLWIFTYLPTVSIFIVGDDYYLVAAQYQYYVQYLGIMLW
mmetsp:Transcript_11909/g.22031  ORF Transcript_11909/g.22031 Transcript_11909/m.22031 type:complete len:109 (+) Transcript_11909:1222-1548(+)